MVKDEEQFIRGCLESLLGWVDRIAILDTGSTDNTISIIKEFAEVNQGQVELKLRHHAWNGNFGEMRTNSVNGLDGDWLLIIDADELLLPTGDREQLNQVLAEIPAEVDCLLMNLVQSDGGSTPAVEPLPRMFRAGCGLHYTGAIHNQPHHPGQYGILAQIGLKHLGDDPAYGRAQQKFQRRTRALKEIVSKGKKDPSAVNRDEFCQAHYYLMQAYGQAGYPAEAAKWAERYLDYREELGSKWQQSTYFSAARAYQKMAAMAQDKKAKDKNLKKALRWINLGLREMPGDLDLAVAFSDQGMHANNIHLAAEGAYRYVNEYILRQQAPDVAQDLKPVYSLDFGLFAHMVHRLAMCRLRQGADALNELRLQWDNIEFNQRQVLLQQAGHNLATVQKEIDRFLKDIMGKIVVPGMQVPGLGPQIFSGTR